MGRRSEQRIVILIPVIVRGTDGRGDPFEIKAETCDISVSGARLRGISNAATLGNQVEVECKGKRAWYRVDWVGKTRTLSANQIGIRLLEPDKYIWSVPPREWAPDKFEPPALSGYDRSALPGRVRKPSYAFPGGEDRRRFPRNPYLIETQVTSANSFVKQPGKITDISLGGCYVEMIGPPPIDSLVELDLTTDDPPLHLSGNVRSSQQGFGMGIEFAEMSPGDHEKLRHVVAPVPAAPEPVRIAFRPPAVQSIAQPLGEGASPVRQSASVAEFPSDHTTTAQALEAMARLLFRKGLLTRAELTKEIETVKSAKLESVR